jgi:hypothetical protein
VRALVALAVPVRALVALELAAPVRALVALELAVPVRALVALELARAAAVPARGQALVLGVLEPAVLVAGQALELVVRAAEELALAVRAAALELAPEPELVVVEPGVLAWLADSRPRCTRSMPSHAARRRFMQATRLRKSRRCGRPRVSRIRTGSAATTWSRQ